MNFIEIRTLYTASEMDSAVELQKIYWGDDMGDLVPAHMLLSIAKHGGQILGAFDGSRLVGLLIGFIGADLTPESIVSAQDRLLVMSKRMVVLPEYRSQKIGERLKFAQRDFAIRHGIPLVTWTFDPLLARNAYLNLHKLGAIGQVYAQDYFGVGITSGVLGADRLVANWWVKHPHVDEPRHQDYNGTPVANSVTLSDESLLTPLAFQLPSHDVIRFEIPAEFNPIERLDAHLTQKWRDHVRLGFQNFIGAGYLATDFARIENRTFYIFTRDDGTYRFR